MPDCKKEAKSKSQFQHTLFKSEKVELSKQNYEQQDIEARNWTLDLDIGF